MSTSLVKYMPEKEVSIDTVKYFLEGTWDTSYEPWTCRKHQPFIIDYPFASLRPMSNSSEVVKISNEFFELLEKVIRNAGIPKQSNGEVCKTSGETLHVCKSHYQLKE